MIEKGRGSSYGKTDKNNWYFPFFLCFPVEKIGQSRYNGLERKVRLR